MKGFLRWVSQAKTYVSLTFTGSVCLVIVLFLALGQEAVPLSMLAQLLAFSLCSTILQWLCFSPQFLGKLRYTLRTGLFLAVLLGVITAFAWLGGWVPKGNTGAWVTFLLIFLALAAAVTLGYEIYFRVSGQRYDQMLEKYRREHGGQ